MRRAILVVRLAPIALALRRVVLVVALALLAVLLRAIVTVVLLAVTAAAAVIIVTRHDALEVCEVDKVGEREVCSLQEKLGAESECLCTGGGEGYEGQWLARRRLN